MKKIISVVLSLSLLICAGGYALGEDAAERVYVRGEIREMLDMTEETLAEVMNQAYQNGITEKLYESPMQAILVPSADKNFRLETRFFGSLSEMLLALDAGIIDGACVPEYVGKYLLARLDGVRAGMVEFSNIRESYYLGFYRNAELRDQVNKALAEMKADGTLSRLLVQYLQNVDQDPEPAKFESFEGAPTLKAAVTGDLPPIDLITENGSPAGFNTALLSELGRRLKINFELVNIESSARTISLTSGVVDVVFWYLYGENYVITDMDNGILLSAPYYDLDDWFYIEKK